MKRPTSGSNLTDAILATAVTLWPAITLGMAFDADRGSVAEWVAALATLGALLAALYAGQQAARIVEVEQRRDAERDTAARRARAEQIAVWGNKGKIYVLNSSNDPIYAARVFAEFAHTSEGDFVPLVQPTPREPKPVEAPAIYEKYMGVLTELNRRGDFTYPRMSVSIEFFDAAGAHWRRDARGTLTPLDPVARDA